jgi:hypothetical protein
MSPIRDSVQRVMKPTWSGITVNRLTRPRIFWILGLLLFSGPFSTHAFECVVANNSQIATGKSIAERAQIALQEEARLMRRAEETFDEYLLSRLDFEKFNSCVSSMPNRQEFLQMLQDTFFSRSIEKFASSTSLVLKNLSGLYARKSPNEVSLFKLTGHYGAPSPTELKGGFHRGEKSIFADFSRIGPNEWFVIFAHELIHSLDETLWNAVVTYADQEKIANLVKQKKTFGNLNLAEKSMLLRWVASGLDRGLWAEYRAWVTTYHIYKAGIEGGDWQKIDWFENWIAQKKSDESINKFIYLSLDEKHTDPETGLLSSPLVKEALTKLREHSRTIELPPLGNLAIFRN